MAPTQPSGAAHQGLNLSSTLSRSSRISKVHRSPSIELHARTRPVLPQTQNHVTVRAPQLSVGAALPSQITNNQGPSSSGQQASISASIANTAKISPPIYIPKVPHRPHPDSRLCQDFHWVPYPLGLMPYESWHSMHHRPSPSAKYRFRCPVCRQERIATAHARKVFLVAERLTWNDAIVSTHDKDLNEELNWAVNYEVGIPEPCVEAGKQLPGGRKSQDNQFYPYQNEHEMRLALKLVFMMDEMTPATWALWIEAQTSFRGLLDGEGMESSEATLVPARTAVGHEKDAVSLQRGSAEPIEMIDLTGSPEPESTHQVPTPSSSLRQVRGSFAQPKLALNDIPHHHNEFSSVKKPQPSEGIRSYKTLQDFYSLLDKIERTSYVGALFLEAYAEKLRDDMCKSCWFQHNVQLDLF